MEEEEGESSGPPPEGIDEEGKGELSILGNGTGTFGSIIFSPRDLESFIVF